MKKTVYDYVEILFRPYVLIVFLGTLALMVSLLPDMFPYLTQKDMASALLSGLITLTGVYAGWILAVRRERAVKQEELKLKKALIDQEMLHIAEEVSSEVLELINQLHKVTFSEAAYHPKLMPMAFEEHFKNAAIIYTEEERAKIRRFYNLVYNFNYNASKSQEQSYRQRDQLSSSDEIEALSRSMFELFNNNWYAKETLISLAKRILETQGENYLKRIKEIDQSLERHNKIKMSFGSKRQTDNLSGDSNL